MLIFPMTAASQSYINYIKNGTEWITKRHVYPCADHREFDYYDKFTLDGDTIVNGFNAMKLYYSYNMTDPVLYAFIRTEGDKVYFKDSDRNPEAPDWYLMYDFGVKIGDIVGVYSIVKKNSPSKFYMKCIGINENADQGFTDIVMEFYPVENPDRLKFPFPTTRWLKGLASECGFTKSNEFTYFVAGMTSELVQVSYKGEIVYKKDKENGISDITVSAKGGKKNTGTYSISGVRISEPSKGMIYIKDGKKRVKR